MTIQRQAILEAMRTSGKHLDAQGIYLAARVICPSLSLGTVYRNLKIMADEGVILRIGVQGKPDYYDINPVPHEHMVCSRCGKLIDVQLPGLMEYLRQETGCRIERCSVTLEGLCPQCQSLSGRAE